MAAKVFTVHTSTIEYNAYGNQKQRKAEVTDVVRRSEAYRSEATRERDSRSGRDSSQVVEDALKALVKDVNDTADVLRRSLSRGSLNRSPSPEQPLHAPIITEQRAQSEAPTERSFFDEFGITQDDSRKTPQSLYSMSSLSRLSNRDISLPDLRPRAYPTCAYCNDKIKGKCLTALAAGAERPQKFHPEHFICSYCTKPLNVRGTYKEHNTKPYCHECSYRLFSGLIMPCDERIL